MSNKKAEIGSKHGATNVVRLPALVTVKKDPLLEERDLVFGPAAGLLQEHGKTQLPPDSSGSRGI
jgi:hypothetical protein